MPTFKVATTAASAALCLLLGACSDEALTEPASKKSPISHKSTQHSYATATSSALPTYADWPAIQSAIPINPSMEARISQIMAGMNLAQKIGQMTQPEIKSISPEEVRRHYIGSVLNGGGSWPGNNKHAQASDWLTLADAYHAAAMSTDMAVPIPLLWGTDAVHGHNNVYGATLFPHNIGLGAANDADLVQRIGTATARAVRATGIHWAFAPTLAVVRDDRWGRTYEGFSEDPEIVAAYGRSYVLGLQGNLGEANVLATAKHFIGDGGTEAGIDQGVNRASEAELINRHGQGYYSALAAGVQTVMVSFNSWDKPLNGEPVGKLHGSHAMLNGVLKTRMGFDGLLVSDWNGIGQIPGCSNASCPQAINAGIDIIMVPDEWRAFISNTMAQVQNGQISQARIDDAVRRILRVKLRAGLFDGKRPSQRPEAGSQAALQARALAREAVRKSLVLMKNQQQLLPLARNSRVLVVGKSANSLQNQTGGWSLSWQGTGNSNADFPVGDTVLAGIKQTLGEALVRYSETASGVSLADVDAVIAVIGETPYAEGSGDIGLAGNLSHSRRYPEDLAVLNAVSGRGVPVVTILLSGRPAHVNDLLNRSSAFISGWLPGTEGAGVADLLFRRSDGAVAYDFSGRLSFSWPATACQTTVNRGDGGTPPLFAYGYGLSVSQTGNLGALDERGSNQPCNGNTPPELLVFRQTDQAPFALQISTAANGWAGVPVGNDLNASLALPASNPSLLLSTTQLNVQQDAKLLTWRAAGQFYAASSQPQDLRSYLDQQGALLFDVQTLQLPRGAVKLAIDCGYPCRGEVDVTALFERLPLGTRQTLKLPLSCFAARGSDFSRINVPFLVYTDQPFSAAFAHVRWQAGAGADADAVRCDQLQAGAAKPGPYYTVLEGGQFAAGLQPSLWSSQAGVVGMAAAGNGELALRWAHPAPGNGLFYVTGGPLDLQAFDHGKLEFELLVESWGGNTQGLAIKLESTGQGCHSNDYRIGRPQAGVWTRFSLPMTEILANPTPCFRLGQLNAPFDLLPVWGDQSGVALRLRKIAFRQ
ncbi:glycoside hydrolase family 3 N-terminal domain-containing protein [Chitinimonas viridis]|uniref:Glycoside hydrolase family 3 N-terminal domain-containing protein n=1 Tax=Chitinimonas viridis TaxID=664880 RepID=A0ABT8B7Q1_9NEIS|nr:glycoside hydrolase family 3 N-terminal domain-containing protein [Chitinimonas viridis]MDN3577514.1 glycoside hydrolase family 3 N-terminal domain-containing protein [Chitinimonas viridis]